ncbi:translation initiation factor IF-2-like [Mustela erminea]|uniref:translation initiation factor IF-2-like n=1 Tax=Mustela erminea TaxID=36723 RepID=UPI001386FF8E|nr:translation initiation factor IF-2-like [Mustela erminea]
MGQASLQTPSACVVRIRVPPESRKNQTQGDCLQILFTPLHFLRRKSFFPWPQFPHLFNLSNTHPRIALGGEKAGLLEKQPLLLSSPRPCSSSARLGGLTGGPVPQECPRRRVSSSREEEEGEAAARSPPSTPRSPAPGPPRRLPQRRQQRPAPPRAPRPARLRPRAPAPATLPLGAAPPGAAVPSRPGPARSRRREAAPMRHPRGGAGGGRR